jgi:hypothetical protein
VVLLEGSSIFFVLALENLFVIEGLKHTAKFDNRSLEEVRSDCFRCLPNG